MWTQGGEKGYCKFRPCFSFALHTWIKAPSQRVDGFVCRGEEEDRVWIATRKLTSKLVLWNCLCIETVELGSIGDGRVAVFIDTEVQVTACLPHIDCRADCANQLYMTFEVAFECRVKLSQAVLIEIIGDVISMGQAYIKSCYICRWELKIIRKKGQYRLRCF